jgi:hypothetical protein
MALVTNKNQTTKRKETNYSEGVFQGVQYDSQEEAVEAGAKAYAKLAWSEITAFMTVLYATHSSLDGELPNLTDEELAKALVASKRKVILESIEKRDNTPKAFQ